jgi:hypothetical protein
MVILNLPVLEGKLPCCALVCEIVTVGVFASPSIGAGVGHLVVEISVMTRYAAPSGGLHRAEEVRGLTLGGDVVEPQAVRAAAVFFVLVLHQGVVLRILTVPGNGAARPSSQA